MEQRPFPDSTESSNVELPGGAELGRDRVERRAQAGADEANGRDNGYADEGGDQAVLNCGCAVFVLKKAVQREHVHSTPNQRHIAPKALKVSGNK